MTLYFFLGIPAKYNLPVEKFPPFWCAIKLGQGRVHSFPNASVQQNISIIYKDEDI